MEFFLSFLLISNMGFTFQLLDRLAKLDYRLRRLDDKNSIRSPMGPDPEFVI
jgi:hypothetical protein